MVIGRPRGKILANLKGVLGKAALSPAFLFTLIGDAFSCLVYFCHEKRILKDFLVGSQNTALTRLQYVNDTIIFSQGETEDLSPSLFSLQASL